MNIGFRTDANSNIGIGHLMRCMAIAFRLIRDGNDVSFYIKDKNAESILRKNDLRNYLLKNNKSANIEDELPELVFQIKRDKIALLIIDSYYVNAAYENILSKEVEIIYIDDLNLFQHNVATIINYNIYAFEMDYQNIYSGSNTKLLLGCAFAPLRKEFENIPSKVVLSKCNKILFTTGGSDEIDYTAIFLKHFIKSEFYKRLDVEVIIGTLNNHCYVVQEHQSYERIHFHNAISRISNIMKDCDIAISAGGTTLYELCACGVPTVCYSFVDNQMLSVKSFENKDIMFYAGDLRDGTDKVAEKSIEYIDTYYLNSSLRQERSHRMQNLVDGKGIYRIVDYIEKY